jgi:hypothetical protein
MSGPFIFIGTHTFKEGKAEDFKKGVQEFCDFIEANEPRLIAFHLYVNEDETEVSIVQVHPDVDSMEFHMQLVRQHIESSYGDWLDTTKSIQVYGELSDTARETMAQLSPPGVPYIVKPSHLGGFTRSSADRAPAPS